MAFRPQILQSAALGLVACALPLASTATAVPSDHLINTTGRDVFFVAKADEGVSNYQQWLAESVMPLLDSASPDRSVSRQEFVFILEAIAAQRIQNFNEEVDAVDSYCETHAEAARYLESRIASFESESDRLASAARSITVSSRDTSPLSPLWRRKQNERLGKTQSRTPDDLKQSEHDEMTSQADKLALDTELVHTHAVELIHYLFGDDSLEDDIFQPAQLVTHGDLIGYFSRQDTRFSQWLAPAEIESIATNYSEAGVAHRQLSILLSEVAEIRVMTEELRGAIATARGRLQTKSAKQTSSEQNIKQAAQANLIPSITSIEEIPDVSPTDPVYTPLKMFVEEFGIDMIQADGRFNGDNPLTGVEFANYMDVVFFENSFFSLTSTCERANEAYAYWLQQTQSIQSDLQQTLYELDEF